MKLKLLRWLLVIMVSIPLLNGCGYSSKKLGEPFDVNAAYKEMGNYLESRQATLEIPTYRNQQSDYQLANLLTTSIVVNKLNSHVNPHLNYSKKYRFYTAHDSELPIYSIVALYWGTICAFSFGLIPCPWNGMDDITTVGVLLDVTSDASGFGEEKDWLIFGVDDLWKKTDSRILGRFKITSQYRHYVSLIIPTAWLFGLSPQYTKDMISPYIKKDEVQLVKEKASIQGLRDILKQLSKESVDIGKE